MNSVQLIQYIAEQYNADAEYPWAAYPRHAVFRHRANRKWFALLMDIPKCKLGLTGGGNIDVLNLKCDPLLTGSLRKEKGFFPAYHMNKENWITAALDGSAEDEKILWLLEMSFELTAAKSKRK